MNFEKSQIDLIKTNFIATVAATDIPILIDFENGKLTVEKKFTMHYVKPHGSGFTNKEELQQFLAASAVLNKVGAKLERPCLDGKCKPIEITDEIYLAIIETVIADAKAQVKAGEVASKFLTDIGQTESTERKSAALSALSKKR